MDTNATTSSAVVGGYVPPYYQSAAVKTTEFSLSSLTIHIAILHPRCNSFYRIIATATQAYTVSINVTSLQLLKIYGLPIIVDSCALPIRLKFKRQRWGFSMGCFSHTAVENSTLYFSPLLCSMSSIMGIHHHWFGFTWASYQELVSSSIHRSLDITS